MISLICGMTSPLLSTLTIAPGPSLLSTIYLALKPDACLIVLPIYTGSISTVGIRYPCLDVFHSTFTTLVISPRVFALNAKLCLGFPEVFLGYNLLCVIIIPSIS